jgi:hypothetical protein
VILFYIGDDMGLVTLVEYARKNGRDPANARQAANRGVFQTAIRLGRDWVIDENEPYPDRRVKSGKYVGWRKSKETKKDEKEGE